MTAEVFHDSFSGSLSSDVFGNDLGEVDIWGDKQGETFSDPKPTAQDRSRLVVEKALKIVEPKMAALALPPMSPQKPPRTPSGSRKTLVVRPPMRRSSGSEGNLRETLKQADETSNTKVLSRTKLRRLQSSNPRLVSPAPEEDSPPKPLSVAEKRRLRHEALFSQVNSLDQTEGDETFPKLGSQSFEVFSNHAGTTAQFDASCSSFSISTSNLSNSVSNGLNHESFDSKELSHSSVGSSFRRRKTSTLGVSPPESEPKRHSIDDLQKQIETVFTECSDVVALVGSPTERKKDAQNPSRSMSSPRSPRRSRTSSSKQRTTARDGSVPRAGGRIKFVRDTKESGDDEKSRKSSRSSQSGGTKSTRLSQPSRASSMAVAPSRPKRGPSDKKPPRARSTPSANLNNSNSQEVQPRSPETPPSPARRRGSGCEGERKGSNSGTPRRKIKYVKNVDLSRSDSMSKLEF